MVPIIYVLTQTYPSELKKYQMAFIHPRIKGYQENGLNVKVVSFRANSPYVYDGVEVLDIKTVEKEFEQTEKFILMSHSPNLRNHLPFINKWNEKISKLFLFFHGHESLYLSRYYPKPFSYTKKERNNYCLHKIYDYLKVYKLGKFIKQRLRRNDTELIYVSNWFSREASKCLRIDYSGNHHVHVINNGLNPYIKEAAYKLNEEVYADVVSIRPIDSPKYGIELIVKFALAHPDLTVHVYGKGEYFKHNSQPENLVHIDKFLLPSEIPDLLNHYRYALMPTFQDTQGVMMCEMASHGIPTIVSDLEVCHEMLDEYPNVKFISNKDFDKAQTDFPTPLCARINRFDYDKTIGEEVRLLKKVMEER